MEDRVAEATGRLLCALALLERAVGIEPPPVFPGKARRVKPKRKRGRPKKEGKLSQAEKMRVYRARKKAAIAWLDS